MCFKSEQLMSSRIIDCDCKNHMVNDLVDLFIICSSICGHKM